MISTKIIRSRIMIGEGRGIMGEKRNAFSLLMRKPKKRQSERFRRIWEKT
jgi:hypothetical protein